jgi:hypothetical protein
VVNEFRLLDELPDDFVREVGKSGLSKDWAEKYWASHWRLPSLTQGFEMFHRGVITYEQLQLLIKAQDVSPFWRDKLTEIAYNPITRIDIRRMYKMGLIDEGEVRTKHLDLGYSPESADQMTAFVVSLVDDTELEDDVDPRQLTMSQVKKLYLQGTLSKNESINMLQEAGYSSAGSIFLVGSWETDQQIKDRETLLTLVTNKAIRENLSITEIESMVAGLDLTHTEREVMQREIVLRSKEYPSTPSKSELKAMFAGGIITYQEWVNAMHRHGYNLIWIERYGKLWGITDGR